jgi:diguanylate cyclase (GGDEF)-like protein
MTKTPDENPYVLIIDNTTASLLALESLIEDLDCHVSKAETGNDALVQCLKNPLACILIDVQMPDIDGYEIAKLIHNNKETAGVPIVLISAEDPTDSEIIKGYESGAVDYVTKPVNPYVIRSKISVFIRMYNQQLQLQKVLDKLDTMAYFDPLTNLYNRRQLNDILLKTHAIALRYKRKYAFLIIDVDNFKHINDLFGHNVGDQVLKQISECLTGNTRASDYVARFGGDEFAIILPEISESEEAGHLARNLLETLAVPFRCGNHEIEATVSIGIACFPQSGDDEGIIKRADIALYKAKNKGKNRFQYFTESLNHEYDRHMQLETELRNALKNKELFVHYQAQVDMHTGQAVGMETLARWTHPKLGIIPPDEFVPIAEEMGVIHLLCLHVVELACKQYLCWQAEKILPIDNFLLAINFSPAQFKDLKLFKKVLEIMLSYKIPLENIVFELTESTFMGESKQLEVILHELSEMSISFSIDDYGTGYSCLSRISQLPINALKIDKSFVQKIGASKIDEAIITSTIALSDNLNLEVIAEGVETEQQADFLRRNGCIYAQGYLYSKPLPPDEMTEYLKNQPAHDPSRKVNRRLGADTMRTGLSDRRQSDSTEEDDYK